MAKVAFTKPIEKAEFYGEQVIADKKIIINLDKQRQKNREALNALKNNDDKKLWLSFGNMFIQLENDSAKNLIKNDQQVLDENINRTRDGLKFKVNELRKIEGQPELQGYNLNPLNKKEMQALKEIVPEVILR